MKTTIDEGLRAFPTNAHDSFDIAYDMTLRDWFAGQALAGLLNAGQGRCTSLASDAYDIADSMLEARKALNST